MSKLKIIQSAGLKEKFDNYPEHVRSQMKKLRALILESASEIEQIHTLEETLRWGEPSYIVKKGSTIRIDWKAKNPEQYAMYFTCSSNLVDTFKIVYGDIFRYEKNRAIVFQLDQKLPIKELKDCIQMALEYHRLKDKPLLGR